MTQPTIYLDHNATTPLRAEARAVMMDAMAPPLNPSSIHRSGRFARDLVEQARRDIADALSCRHADLVFTSGATESNNMVLSGFDTIITSAVEHEAVRAPRPDAARIAVDQNGVLDLAALDAQLSQLDDDAKTSTLVSVIAANNETGVLQPLSDIGAICQSHKVAFHSDMVQWAGKMPLVLSDIKGLSFASLSAHKIGGPSGSGALWIAPGRMVPSLLQGGGQEQGRRAGTENARGILGFGAAMKAACANLSHFTKLAVMRDAFEADLLAEFPDMVILGKDAPRLGNTSAIAFEKMPSNIALMALDLKGFCLSSGSACSSGKVKASHVVEAMGYPDLSPHILRISTGWTSAEDELQMLVKALITL